MNDRFFTIHALNPAEDAEKLNAFLAANAVLSVERQFVGWGEERTPTTLNRNANSPDNRNIGVRLAGALWAGGSINQRPVLFRWFIVANGQSSGPRCVSRRNAESLPVGCLISEISS